MRLGAFVEEGVSVEQEVGEVEVGDDSNKVELCGFRVELEVVETITSLFGVERKGSHPVDLGPSR